VRLTRQMTRLMLVLLLSVIACKDRKSDRSTRPIEETTPVVKLHLAAQKGDLAQVQSLIAGGCDVDARDPNGRTPLYTAALYDQAKVAEFLISKGADVNAEDVDAFTVLDAAGGNIDIARMLIEAGADVNAGVENGRSALYGAGREHIGPDPKGMVELLLASGAQILPGDRLENEVLLCFAVRHGLRDLVGRLLAVGANANARDMSGASVLVEAVTRKEKEIATLLITSGADVNRGDERGMTPLCYAHESNRDMMELLLTHGADVNARGVLHRAVAAGDKPIVELFLAHGADVNIKDSNGDTPLDEAVARGDKDIAEILRGHGAKEGEKADSDIDRKGEGSGSEL
jgi:ankyrin repeat protein